MKPSAYLKLKISDLPFKRVTQISPPLSTETMHCKKKNASILDGFLDYTAS